MKTLGQIAFESFYGDNSGRSWVEDDPYNQERWERAGKAVAIAYEDSERKAAKCETAPATPAGTTPLHDHHFTCLEAPEIVYPSYLAKVRA